MRRISSADLVLFDGFVAFGIAFIYLIDLKNFAL